METIMATVNDVFSAIKNLTAEQIALLSLVVSLIIYLLSKRYELKIKKHDAKKEHYAKLINLFSEIMQHAKDKDDKWTRSESISKSFFDVGSSLAVYGSKRLYKAYVFSRSLETNPYIYESKYYSKEILIYLYAKMFRLIRKEAGLNSIGSVTDNDILAFFVNDIGNNPVSMKKSYRIKYSIKMIKVELFFVNIITFVHAAWIYNRVLRPVIGVVAICIKFIFFVPVKRILSLLPFGKKISASGKM